ncbi:polymorphic toxin-type HINT domain-containing protein, partial [Nonomuraea sp. NPDC049421]|uniref:polymorphic toxin-type HINT domain-containing protein n=1 Tax=Nonomuraea sp. NPDC049421 TaxID=3155275 RepID=UPI003416BAEE
DGSTKPIEKVETGDEVVATDQATGRTEARPVLALISSKGVKKLVDITVTVDGAKDVITATDNHPFWVPKRKAWLTAGALQPGMWLQTSAGTYVQITAIAHRTATQRVHNLTVQDLHTYHVVAGSQAILVHNDQIPYSEDNPLCRAVLDRRAADNNKTGNNYGAALLDDGEVITGRSNKRRHAEQDLMNQANGREILELFSEREPCANKCEELTRGMNPSWAVPWNGVDRSKSNADLKEMLKGLFNNRG